MAKIDLTQEEADNFIKMEKNKVDDLQWTYPGLGGSIAIPLISINKKEKFTLDITRGNINLSKGTYQNRTRIAITLVRLDFGGSPHRNPDDEEIQTPHLHIYRAGYGDKWAYNVPEDKFPNMNNDPWKTLEDFMKFCNIINPPKIERGLCK